MATKPKPCPNCGHPMMEGPLRLGNGDTLRMVAWWCANCHHAIEVKPTPPPRQSRTKDRRMASKRWSVWSKDPSRDAWMVVEPNVSEQDACDGAARRARTALRMGMEAKFMALPRGETPHNAKETPDAH